MFKITLSNVDLLRNSIPIISEIIDEGVFKVDSNGLSLVSPDRSMIAVVNFQLLASAFDDFNVTGEEALGLNLANLVAVIKRIKTGDKVTLKKDEGMNVLEVVLEGRGRRRFEVPLLDITGEKPPLDQLEFKGKVELDSSVLEEGISDADIVDDSVVLETNPDAFKMWAKGDISSAQLELKKGEEGLRKLESAEALKSRYPLEYLKKMIKAAKLSEQVDLEFGTDYPMRLNFKSIDKVNLSFVLAPRVEE
ncbi:MAG: proliferating cell nuclear antigen (pcna) [Candidatus Aenigmarchaeota archaeon]|nr:proliferating cell nuclear antigen (pcna) [Candidatus Aenigmarchaeota archaeon]NIP41056.1 proliferating cell nuclear antigen (pcna) [Candidatus Aenigmarchaeota archaeon]NIQ17458.1 proliferating cell nuclear antigen (pcna) [Candidatus Aenigmarchaeota archaeon]NIS73652.1 proliferating cell nuclear antigen (pcna) [Candidatus Aenigmarchaeota archaeon]